MGDGEKKGSGSPAPLIIAAIVVAVGVVIKRFDLESWRPPQSERTAHYSQPLQTVPSRLWQDPLTAIAELRGKSELPAGIFLWGTPDRIVDQYRLETRDVKRVNVILVPVFGGPYAEYGEGRRRQRYAIATGLLESDFAPAEPEKLGVLRHTFSAAPDMPFPRTLPTVLEVPRAEVVDIPFEWYACKTRKPSRCEKGSHVLVMWVNDDLLGSEPLTRLASLYPTPDPERPYELTKAVIGPAGSGTLIKMAREAHRYAGTDAVTPMARMRVYSPNATIDLTALAEEAIQARSTSEGGRVGRGTPDAAPPSAHQVFQRAGMAFVSTIASDAEMAETLAREVTLRQFSVRCLWDSDGSPPGCLSDYKVLMISEGDTEYARSLTKSFKDSLMKSQCDAVDRRCRDAIEKRVFGLTYLRGLDGETARTFGETPDRESKKPGGRSDSRSPDHSLELLRAGETAAGNAQYDYLRRLGRNAKAIERAASQHGPALFHAIVVFGSDAYDKLLIMQALRMEFPSAFFMTTDMDARYLQRDQLGWSRNLIVASSYGLQLNPALRDHSAPFRDAYQGAQFLAARLAVARHCDWSAQSFIDSGLGLPRLLEISTAGPVKLSEFGFLPQSAIPDMTLRDGAGALSKDADWLKQRAEALARADVEVGTKLMCTEFGDARGFLHPPEDAPRVWYKKALFSGLGGLALLVTWYSLHTRRGLWHVAFAALARWPEILIGAGLVLWVVLPSTNPFLGSAIATAAVCILAWWGRSVWYGLRARHRRLFRVTTGILSLLFVGVVVAPIASQLLVNGWIIAGTTSLAVVLGLPLGAAVGLFGRPTRLAVPWSYLAILKTALILVLAALWVAALYGEAEEPIGFFNGASSWPAEFMRAAALIFNLWAIARVFAILGTSEKDINKKFFRTLASTGATASASAGSEQRNWRQALKGAWVRLVEACKWPLQEWSEKHFLKAGKPEPVLLWRHYVALCNRKRLRLRALVGSMLFMVALTALTISDAPVPPVRGVWSTLLDTTLLILSIATFFFLIFLVVDVVRITAKFVHYLSLGETAWPDSVFPYVKIAGVGRAVRDIRDLELLSLRTEAVSKLVMLPFWPLLLLVLARHEAVDAWAWTWPLVVLFTLCFACLIGMSVHLRNAAEKGKGDVLWRLTQARLKALGKKNPVVPGYLENAIRTLERMTAGAYSPLWRADWLRGLAIPTTGVGVLEILRAAGAF